MPKLGFSVLRLGLVLICGCSLALSAPLSAQLTDPEDELIPPKAAPKSGGAVNRLEAANKELQNADTEWNIP